MYYGLCGGLDAYGPAFFLGESVVFIVIGNLLAQLCNIFDERRSLLGSFFVESGLDMLKNTDFILIRNSTYDNLLSEILSLFGEICLNCIVLLKIC
jgi:hypothetical protein